MYSLHPCVNNCAILAQDLAQESGELDCRIVLACKETGKKKKKILYFQLNQFQFCFVGWLPNSYNGLVQWVRAGSRDARLSLFYANTAVKKLL